MQEPKLNQDPMTEPAGQQVADKNTEPNTHQEDKGVKEPGRLFTQEEVNKIVSDRLNRERMKTEPNEQDTREIELSRRENKFACREFLDENSYRPGLIDVFDTADLSQFKEAVKKLESIVPEINEKNPAYIPPNMPGMGPISSEDDSIARAFKLR